MACKTHGWKCAIHYKLPQELKMLKWPKESTGGLQCCVSRRSKNILCHSVQSMCSNGKATVGLLSWWVIYSQIENVKEAILSFPKWWKEAMSYEKLWQYLEPLSIIKCIRKSRFQHYNRKHYILLSAPTYRQLSNARKLQSGTSHNWLLSH